MVSLPDPLDDEFPLGDGVADLAAEFTCPHCGAASTIALDPGGGAHQEYVEDCQICCEPCLIHLRYRADGSAEVWVGET